MKKVTIIALGGCTCSGKTTLAKLLAQIIPSAIILHQDDFAPNAINVPFHSVHKELQDWDSAPTAIQWIKQRAAIKYLREHGTYPPGHSSHDHLNLQIEVPVAKETIEEWKEKFKLLDAEKENTFVIADGFLILYDKESVRDFDVRLLVRESYQVLKDRREERNGYHTGEGEYWKDPPNYWDKIVYPAYVNAHESLFKGGDVESGEVDESEISGVVLLEGRDLTIEEMIDKSCTAIIEQAKSGKTAKHFAKP